MMLIEHTGDSDTAVSDVTAGIAVMRLDLSQVDITDMQDS